MTEETTSSSITRSGRLVRLFVGGLPLGLVIMGALSFVFYFNKKNKPDVQPVRFAASMQKDLNVADFQRYLRVLHEDLGERTVRQPENLEAAAAFMDSTMGADNMGYATMLQEFDEAGKPLANIMVQLTGSTQPAETVAVVATHHSSEANTADEAAASSLLLCLANDFTGRPQGKSVVFLSLGNPAATRDDANGCWQASQHAVIKDLKLTKFIFLEPASGGNGAEGRVGLFRMPQVWKDVPVTKIPVSAGMGLEDLRAVEKQIQDAAR